ncbi:hypothetical protein [Bifidobacterium myosotis]|uniref:Uncharacterized protein n=1 Tax=Bifidobacterium myosotis TaxID=1630166 RepID=A0A5M9ZHK5_9BIFI|nr:hypothetical protein [Bifidobacterium myosotis]KAA8826939.1 hypothetical protein EMO91_10435 [Bifidobacterium myosotis]
MVDRRVPPGIGFVPAWIMYLCCAVAPGLVLGLYRGGDAVFALETAFILSYVMCWQLSFEWELMSGSCYRPRWAGRFHFPSLAALELAALPLIPIRPSAQAAAVALWAAWCAIADFAIPWLREEIGFAWDRRMTGGGIRPCRALRSDSMTVIVDPGAWARSYSDPAGAALRRFRRGGWEGDGDVLRRGGIRMHVSPLGFVVLEGGMPDDRDLDWLKRRWGGHVDSPCPLVSTVPEGCDWTGAIAGIMLENARTVMTYWLGRAPVGGQAMRCDRLTVRCGAIMRLYPPADPARCDALMAEVAGLSDLLRRRADVEYGGSVLYPMLRTLSVCAVPFSTFLLGRGDIAWGVACALLAVALNAVAAVGERLG